MKIRTTRPSNNKYYKTKSTGGLNGCIVGRPTITGANVLANCVGFANGRFNEIINDPELKGIVKPFKYQLTTNAENFIESAKAQGLKISSTPIQGGIMVWKKGATLKGSDGAGHVAVVEEVYDDGTILTSESGYNAYAFRTAKRDNTNGRWSQPSGYTFRGCIVNPGVTNPKVVPAPKLTVDGIGGAATVRAMQRFFSTTQDGVISGQLKTMSKYYPSLKAVEYGKNGSPCIKNLQRWTGVAQDGVLGPGTVKAWQKKLGVTADGIFGTNSMKAWQKYLNEHDKAVYPEPTPTPTPTPTTNAKKLAETANSFAWSTNTKKADYPSGAPTAAYKAGLNKAYPDRSKWGAAPKAGASCDVFVGTCVRCAGIDSKFPRGLSPSYIAKSDKFKEVSKSNVQDGDIIITSKHVCIVCGGKIKEASLGDFYPKTTATLSKRLNASGAKVYRAK